MAFNRPSLQELIDRNAADIESRLPGTDARLRRNNLGVLSKVHSVVAHGLYAFLEFISKQILPDTASVEWLERHASIHDITRKTAAKAAGTVTFTGDNTTVVPAGTEIQRGDQVAFITDNDGTIDGGSVTVAITAVEAGASGNTEQGTTLTFVTPLAGIDSQATVDASGITNGTDAESDDALRVRVLDKIQQPPHGGASFDYVKWALEVSGVTRAWAYAQENGLGTVTVRFVVDDDPDSLIPDAAKVQEVQDYIDTVRPVTADVLVGAPVAVDLNFTITGLNPGNVTVQAAVEQELADLLRNEAEPGGTILISHIREAISIAAGEHDHALSSPVADVTHATGEIAVMGAITWA